ncbi:hypothetical protein OQA88_3111 [Cercophora sp. LCS_1]
MASEEADQQFAADVDAQLVQGTKELLTAALRKPYETQDRVIKDAWKKILDSLQVAQDTQSKVVSIYNTRLSESTIRTITAGLAPETLPSYRDIAAHFTNSSPRSLLVNTAPTVPPAFPSPQASPIPPRSQHLGQAIAASVPDQPRPAPVGRSGTLTADNENSPVPNNQGPSKRVAKRGRGVFSAATQPSRKRARTDREDTVAMKTVDANLVRAREYIFPFPTLGRDWNLVIGALVSEETGEVVDESWVAESNRKLPSGPDYAGETGVTTSAASNQVPLARSRRA